MAGNSLLVGLRGTLRSHAHTLKPVADIVGCEMVADPLFHQVVAVVCAVIVVRAILPGFREHRSRAVAGLAIAGIGLLFVAAFVLPDVCCSAPADAHGEDCLFCQRAHAHAATLSRPLLTAKQLESGLGKASAGQVMAWQPFLSPMGGLLLILAHLVNIRLKLNRCGCSKPHPASSPHETEFSPSVQLRHLNT